MKKFLMTLIASLLVVTISGLAMSCQKNEVNSNSSDQSQQNSQEDTTTPPDDSSSTEEPEKGPDLVERVSAKQVLSDNYQTVNLKDVYLLKDGNYNILKKLFKDVKVGDMALLLVGVTGSKATFGYYSDGNWYNGSAPNHIKMINVVNAVFNYEPFSGKPLALTESDLVRSGDQKVVDCIISQFDESGYLVPKLLEYMEKRLPSTYKLASTIGSITVRELYNETLENSDHAFVNKMLNEIDVNTVTNSIFEIVDETSTQKPRVDYSKVNALINKVISGKLANPVVNFNVNVDDLLAALKPLLDQNDKVTQTTLDQLIMLYSGVAIKDIKTATNQLNTIDVLRSVEVIINTKALPENQAKIKAWFSGARRVFGGTLEKITINTAERETLNNLLKQILDEVNKGKDNVSASVKLADLVIELNNLRNELALKAEDASLVIERYIKKIAGYIDESGISEQANAFIKDLSKYLGNLYNGLEANLDAFLKAHSGKSLKEIDAYLNGYITDLVTKLDIKIGDLLEQVKVSDVITYINEPIEFVHFLYVQYIKPELTKNPDMTLGDYDKQFLNGVIAKNLPEDYKSLLTTKLSSLDETIEALFENFKVASKQLKSIIATGTMRELDDVLTGGEFNAIVTKYGNQKLLDYKVQDYISLTTKTPNEQLKKDLEDLKLVSLSDIITKIVNDVKAMLPQKPQDQQEPNVA